MKTCEILIDTLKHITHQSSKEYLSLILTKNLNKRTPIHEAAKTGNFEILNLFFRLINQNERNHEDFDDEFRTSLHLAAAAGHTQIVQLLIDQGANVSSCDMNDSTPLHEAAAYNHYHCVDILLQSQAPLNQFDGKHNTPLHRASQHGHWNIVRLLLNSNADVRLINSEGYNSLEVAILNNHQLTVREFLNHKTWTKSLRNAQVPLTSNNNNKHEHLSTPLRKLIRYMPNEANEVFSRSITEIGGSDDYSYKIIFNNEFLEDQFSIFKWRQGEGFNEIFTV